MFKLSEARELCDLVLKEGRRLKCNPLTIVVLDKGGHILCCMREEESGILRFEIAKAKAWGALGMGFGTQTLSQLTSQQGTMNAFVTALMVASEGKVVPTRGGVIIKNKVGETLGAIGVSGDAPEQDERCILHAIEKLELEAQP